MIKPELIQKAIYLSKNGAIAEAETLYKELIAKYPEEELLLSAAGLFYIEIGNYDNAIKFLKKACNIKESLGTLSSVGFAELKKGNYREAAYYLEKSLAYGENPDIYSKLVIALYESSQLKKAIEYSDKIYERYPDNPIAIAIKAKSLTHSGKMIEAEKLCTDYLKLHGNEKDSAKIWCELGYLKELIYRDDNKAKECYKISYNLGNYIAKYDIAVSCEKLGQLEEAENLYRTLTENKPKESDFYVALGMCLLKQKKFHEGFKYFASRDSKIFQNIWQNGEPIEDNLTIISEGGFGDNIQFIRYIPFLKDKNPTIVVSKSLIKLFKENYPEFKFITFDSCDTEKKCLRMIDLPFALNLDFNHIPFSDGYLNVQPLDIKNNKLKVGLCWEANAAGIRSLINRTIPIKCFEPFFSLENVQFYSFQYDDSLNGNIKYPQMINLAKDFKDFADTAEALKSMDLIITVDTAVAHLAGALGLKTYLLLPYFTDWRWFSDTKTTPWYNSIEIFKQQTPLSWDLPFKEIYSRLKENNII